jgi:hypothetical protein
MMTRELEPMSEDDYGAWLGLDPAAQPGPRPEMSRGQGGYVHPAAILSIPTGLGMDPSDPSTYSRPYNPQTGMFGRLHHDEARKAQSR